MWQTVCCSIQFAPQTTMVSEISICSDLLTDDFPKYLVVSFLQCIIILVNGAQKEDIGNIFMILQNSPSQRSFIHICAWQFGEDFDTLSCLWPGFSAVVVIYIKQDLHGLSMFLVLSQTNIQLIYIAVGVSIAYAGIHFFLVKTCAILVVKFFNIIFQALRHCDLLTTTKDFCNPNYSIYTDDNCLDPSVQLLIASQSCF